MIRVTVQLDSGISEDRDRELATVKIWNDLTGTSTRGNYKYEIRGKKNKLMDQGRIAGWPRNDFNVIDLVTYILVDARGDRIVKAMG